MNTAGSFAGQMKEMHIYDYLRIIFKWRRIALICFLVIVFTVTIGSFIMTPVYKATTRLLIEKEAPKILNIQDIMPVDASGTEFYQTQYKILQSRSLAFRVIHSMNLAQNPKFNKKAKDISDKPLTPQEKKEIEMSLVPVFLSRLKVEPIRNSRLVDVSFESTDPVLAADITNAIARNYIDQTMGWKSETSKEAKEFLEKQIEEQKKNLEESEQALQRYKEQYGIVQVTSTTQDRNEQNISMQKLSGLTSALVMAQSARIEAEARYKEVQDLLNKGAKYESIPQVTADYQVQRLRENEAKLMSQISELSQKYGEKHPKMVQLKKELETIQKSIADESKRVINSIKNEYLIAKAKEDNARRAVEAQKAETQKMSERAIQYSVLLREVEKNRELYENLLKRLKETTVSSEIGTTNIRIVDHAEVPKTPFKPKKFRNFLLSIVVGLFMGIGLAFFFEYLDNTVKTPEDIQKYLQVPNLALIPKIDFKKEVGEDIDNPQIITFHKPKSNISEAFRSLRTSVLFSFPEHTPKSLVITSFTPGEGKTFASINLSLIMAYAGQKVLLIDADMRKPQLHKTLKLENDMGLSNFIIGEEPFIQPSGLDERLHIMTSGPIPPNPSELLGSQRMADFVEKIKKEYDMVIIDSPPISSVTDALIIGSKLVDGIILVIHGGVTTKEMAIRAVNQIRAINARIIGAVLNNIDLGKESYYYSHYYPYYYHYYYYYDESKEKIRKKGRIKSLLTQEINIKKQKDDKIHESKST